VTGERSRAPRVAVVGAGLGGLAAAHRLVELAAESARPLDLVVLEAGERAGGVAGTEVVSGALLELGPDSLVAHKPAGLALCRRLGLGDRLVPLPAGRIDVLHRGRLAPVPAGFALLAPTQLAALAASPLLGWRGKLRALAELAVAPRREEGDESVAAFVRRRFGGQLLGRLVEPIVGAIYMADVERLSLRATFPRFAALERERGSVLRGFRAARPQGSRPAPPAVVSLSGGIARLVEALVGTLPPGALALGTAVDRIARVGEVWTLGLADGRSLAVDAVVVATPAHAAARLLAEADGGLARELAAIDYASCVTVHLGWPLAAAGRPPRGQGFFVPAGAGGEVVAATFVHVKHPERVPAGWLVARVFLGGALHPQAATRSAEELVDAATARLAPLLGLSAPAAWSHVVRHSGALPQLAVGHLARVARLRERLAAQPGLALAGGPVGAYGVPDAIAEGEGAAERIAEWLTAVAGRRAPLSRTTTAPATAPPRPASPASGSPTW
jgi:protoporphyrinogen/coproporphyrinogen III oxidase